MKIDQTFTKQDLVELLNLDDFTTIYRQADKLRQEQVGDQIHIRAIIEFSNYCKRHCKYCGLNCTNTALHRFRMTSEEIITTVKSAYEAGYKTIVMQSGEDPFFTPTILGEIVKEIAKTKISITISCGEMSFEGYAYLKECGADRYLLKHETADPEIYKQLHPCSRLQERVDCLRYIKQLGYETGSGFMIGLPGQTLKTIAEDILLLKEIGCHMAGIGPFIPHPDTPLRDCTHGDVELTKRAVALTRLVIPTIHLPATTSLGVVDSGQKDTIFSCGANVVMKKVTPDPYKALYEIYPSSLGKTDILAERKALEQQIVALGRIPL